MKLISQLWEESGSVAAGISLVVRMPVDGDLSVTAAPGGSGTVTVEFTDAPAEDITAGTAIWIPSSITASATTASVVRNAPTRAVRITAATAAARYQLLQRSVR